MALCVAGCGTSNVAETVITAYRFAVSGQSGPLIDRETVSSLPYASIAAKIGKGPRSLLILWRQDRGELHWLSADGAAVVTKNGRVVKTAGLPETIRETGFLAPDPLEAGLHEASSFAVGRREIELEVEGTRQRVFVDSTFRRIRPRRIEITEVELDTILVEEHCRATEISWKFQNRYWVDPFDGFVWRSEQTIARSFDQIMIEILKPAST